MEQKTISWFFRSPGRIFLLVVLICAAILILIPLLTYAYYSGNLSSKETIMNSNNTGIILTDRNDKPFFQFNQPKNTKVVPLNEISIDIQHAVVASEDKHFYEHQGFAISSILRSLYWDVLQKDFSYGGSTLTQQLVKTALLSPSKNILRKYQELVLASIIEKKYSKQEILEMYLNSAYFGEGAFGIGNAAKLYFNKRPSDLTLAEASLLTGLLPAPSAYSPLSNDPSIAKKRQELVLSVMMDQGYITREEKQIAGEEKITYHETSINNLNQIAPHFALMVRDQLIKQYGEEYIGRSGFKVRTTIDLDWQQFAEQTVRQQVSYLAGSHVSNGAAVVIDPHNGAIRSLVGSADWNNEEYGKVNMATGLRQPGSSFKPLVYATAIENKIITPSTILHDVPTTFDGNYKPLDYDRGFRGDVLPRRALANSLNIPAVEVLSKVGVQNAVEFAKTAGITSLTDSSRYGLSLVLGGGEVRLTEMAGAYGAFANEGIVYTPYMIESIADKNGHVIYKNRPTSNTILSKATAYIISSILSDNAARAATFGSALTISRPAAVKTGTTDNYRDAWTLGYTPSLVVGVWVGNNDYTAMTQVAGSLGAAPIWRRLMEKFLAGTPVEQFTKPDGVENVSICAYNGLVSHTATSSAYTEYYLTGTAPNQTCDGSPLNTPITIPTAEVTPTDTPSNTPIPQASSTPEPTTTTAPTNTPTPQITLEVTPVISLQP